MYAATEQQQERQRVHVLADQLYRERYHYLLRIACRNGAGDDADDAVNDAFSIFLDKFDPDCGAPPLAWVTTTLKRRCWARYRLQRRSWSQRSDRDCDSCSDPDDPLEGAEEVAAMRSQLAELKPAERRVLVLIAAGYSYREVGQITGFSYTKTNRSAAEGRAALRSAMTA